ncbi:hypothetical protein G7Y89_g6579 [Cudoniella acicularis]|uniref:Nnf1-domain-containing protein n=1 Tax=Cudoniella acicularis TaxID=354080 RepID=A0A8H4RL10_9HELO|nr:hypothetical protein G7Y89_g6579 [Cudoniella acicularis]
MTTGQQPPAPEPGRMESSPSPPPQPPIPSTPGPRAQALTTLYQKTLSATLSAISYDAFAACFPHIAAQAPAALKAYHAVFVERLGGLALDEFQQILLEKNVVRNLNELEDIIASARIRKSTSGTSSPPVQPHTLPPPELLTAHLGPVRNSQQSLLNAGIQTIQSQNAQLLERIKEQRKEIEGLRGVLEGMVRDLEGAGVAVGEQGPGLSEGAREVEEVLSGRG